MPHCRRPYRLGELTALGRAARFEVLKGNYANSLLLVPIAADRLTHRWLPRRTARSDVLPVPRPVEQILAGIIALERWLLRWLRVPLGILVVLVVRKP